MYKRQGYAFYSSNNPALGSFWRSENSVAPIPADLQGRNEAEMDSALMLSLIHISEPTRPY